MTYSDFNNIIANNIYMLATSLLFVHVLIYFLDLPQNQVSKKYK